MFHYKETFIYFCLDLLYSLDKLFDIIISEEAFVFLENLEKKHYEKILYNIRKSQTEIDRDLFKKLEDEIWEFRTIYQGLKYRLFSFWDKEDRENTFVIATHGIIKKDSKIPRKEIEKAKRLRIEYFNEKKNRKKK